ncbi:MAG: glycosyltransferase family 4 protein [Ahrensia sp.]
MAVFSDFDRLLVIAPNFKRRLSGVTSTIIQLVPEQARQGLAIATLGPGLPDHLPKLRFRDLWRLWKRPIDGRKRIWHARRNTEMVGGIILRDGLRMPLKLVFTSASQRHHRRFTKWLISRMDHVIATSAKTAGYLERDCTVIMHGIDTERFSPPHDKRAAKVAVGLDPDSAYIGCFGRIRPSKGTDIFVDAMQQVLPEAPGWQAVIAGRATEKFLHFERELKQRAATEQTARRVHFVGEHTDIERWYQAMDLFVAPQRWEGFGLTPLEAMACGVPVVATDTGAFATMVEPLSPQSVVPVDDCAALSAAISAAIANPMSGTDVSRFVRDNFALSVEAKAINGVYDRLAKLS